MTQGCNAFDPSNHKNEQKQKGYAKHHQQASQKIIQVSN